jgi:hypothetical protein
LATEPFDYRTVLSNEIVFDIDNGWTKVSRIGKDIVSILRRRAIPHYIALTGGRGIHIHVFFDIAYGTAEEMVTLAGIDFRHLRMFIFNDICRDAGIPRELIGKGLTVDTATVDWTEKGKGHLVREFLGAKVDENGTPIGYKTLTDHVPLEREVILDPTEAKFPEELKVWHLPANVFEPLVKRLRNPETPKAFRQRREKGEGLGKFSPPAKSLYGDFAENNSDAFSVGRGRNEEGSGKSFSQDTDDANLPKANLHGGRNSPAPPSFSGSRPSPSATGYLALPCVQTLLRDGIAIGRRNLGSQVIAIACCCDGLTEAETREILDLYYEKLDTTDFRHREMYAWLKWIYSKPEPFWVCKFPRQLGLCSLSCILHGKNKRPKEGYEMEQMFKESELVRKERKNPISGELETIEYPTLEARLRIARERNDDVTVETETIRETKNAVTVKAKVTLENAGRKSHYEGVATATPKDAERDGMSLHDHAQWVAIAKALSYAGYGVGYPRVVSKDGVVNKVKAVGTTKQMKSIEKPADAENPSLMPANIEESPTEVSDNNLSKADYLEFEWKFNEMLERRKLTRATVEKTLQRRAAVEPVTKELLIEYTAARLNLAFDERPLIAPVIDALVERGLLLQKDGKYHSDFGARKNSEKVYCSMEMTPEEFEQIASKHKLITAISYNELQDLTAR